MSRTAGARGQSYGYLVAWHLAGQVHAASGLAHDPLDGAAGRRLAALMLGRAGEVTGLTWLADLLAQPQGGGGGAGERSSGGSNSGSDNGECGAGPVQQQAARGARPPLPRALQRVQNGGIIPGVDAALVKSMLWIAEL